MNAVRVLSVILIGVLYHSAAYAQPRRDDAAGALACAGCGGFFIVTAGLFVLQIALLVWVAKDAKSRGMDSAVVWMLFVFFVPFIGLVVYIFSRPQGVTIKCASCGNKRLQSSAKCPHCGNP